MEDRVKKLSQSLLVEKDAVKVRELAAELRNVLSEYVASLRARLANYPLSRERRKPRLTKPTEDGSAS